MPVTALLVTLALLGAGWSAPQSVYERLNCNATGPPTAVYATRCFVYHEPGAPDAGFGWSTGAVYEFEEDIWYYRSSFTADLYWGFMEGSNSQGSPIGIPSRFHGMQVLSDWDGTDDNIYFRKGGYLVELSLFETYNFPTSPPRPPVKVVLSLTTKAVDAFEKRINAKQG